MREGGDYRKNQRGKLIHVAEELRSEHCGNPDTRKQGQIYTLQVEAMSGSNSATGKDSSPLPLPLTILCIYQTFVLSPTSPASLANNPDTKIPIAKPTNNLASMNANFAGFTLISVARRSSSVPQSRWTISSSKIVVDLNASRKAGSQSMLMVL